MFRLRQQQLEDRHSQVEYQLRCLMAIPGQLLVNTSYTVWAFNTSCVCHANGHLGHQAVCCNNSLLTLAWSNRLWY